MATDRRRDDAPVLVSPFLNFDPSLIVSDPNEKFIYPEETKQRGKFERAFSEIGGLLLGGAAVGSARGLYLGMQDPSVKQLPAWSLQRSHIINHITKGGASFAQSCGSMALLYALWDFGLHKARGGADDEINTVMAATAAGLTFKSVGIRQPGGYVRCLKGGSVGFVIGVSIAAFSNWGHVKQILGVK